MMAILKPESLLGIIETECEQDSHGRNKNGEEQDIHAYLLTRFRCRFTSVR